MIHDFCSQHSNKFSEFSNQKVTFDSWRRDVPRRSGIRKATSMASRPVEMWWTGTQRPSSMAWPSERLPRSWRSMTGSSGGEHHPKNRENMGHDDNLYGKNMLYIYNTYIYITHIYIIYIYIWFLLPPPASCGALDFEKDIRFLPASHSHLPPSPFSLILVLLLASFLASRSSRARQLFWVSIGLAVF